MHCSRYNDTLELLENEEISTSSCMSAVWRGDMTAWLILDLGCVRGGRTHLPAEAVWLACGPQKPDLTPAYGLLLCDNRTILLPTPSSPTVSLAKACAHTSEP